MRLTSYHHVVQLCEPCFALPDTLITKKVPLKHLHELHRICNMANEGITFHKVTFAEDT